MDAITYACGHTTATDPKRAYIQHWQLAQGQCPACRPAPVAKSAVRKFGRPSHNQPCRHCGTYCYGDCQA